MVGWSIQRSPNGIRLYVPLGRVKREPESPKSVIVFLDEDECHYLAESILDAQRKYWKKETIGEFERRIMEKAEYHGDYHGSSQDYDANGKAKPTMIWLEDIFKIIEDARREFLKKFGLDGKLPLPYGYSVHSESLTRWFVKWFGDSSDYGSNVKKREDSVR
ncbi:MAG: hypothetical protein ACTSSA_12500 [Candidatus Freyarchaeota archaeon]